MTFVGNNWKRGYYAIRDGAADYPEIVDVAVTNISSATTSHVVTLPTPTEPGLRFLVFSCCDFDSATTFTQGDMVESFNETQGDKRIAVVHQSAFTSTTLTWTTNATEQSAHIAYLIRWGPGQQTVYESQFFISARATGTSGSPNAADLSPTLTLHPGQTRQWLWISAFAGNNGVSTSSAPSGYADLQQSTLSGGGSVELATAWKTSEATSENAGAFSAGSTTWAAWTVGMYIQWTDLTPDVLIDPGPTTSRGISGTGPLDLVSDPGRISFTLNNAASNTGGTAGWYSPRSSTVRTGFRHGIPIVLWWWPGAGFGASQTSGYYLKSVQVQGGPHIQRAICTGVDWMERASRSTLGDLAILTDQTDVQAIGAIIDAIPGDKDLAQRPSKGSGLSVGNDEYEFVFSDVNSNSTSAMELFQRAAQSSLGYLILEEGSVVGPTTPSSISYRDRFETGLESGGGTFNAGDILSLDVTHNENHIYNIIDVETPSRRTDESNTTVLYSIDDQRPVVPAGETLNITLDYRDPENEAERVGGVDMINPVATTDYTMNSLADGTGVNRTSDFTVTPTFGASHVELAVANTGSNNAVVTFLQGRGRGVYEYQSVHSIAEDATSILEFGERRLQFRMPWQSNSNFAQETANWLLSRHKDANAPGTVDVTMVINADKNATSATRHAGTLTLGVQVNLPTEATTGLEWNATDLWVATHVTERHLSDGSTEAIYKLRFLGPPQGFWVLGVTANDELDTDTKLGYF
jgi:hypothetical protein